MTVLQSLTNIFEIFPNWLATILISCLPVAELRGAIPIALLQYQMHPAEAYLFAVIGNMLPVIPLLLYLEPVSNYLRRFRFWDKFFNWLFTRTRHNHSETFEKYGTLGLAIFVAIPLPATGAWTGCAAAFVFGIGFRHALMAISAGVLVAGAVVTIVTLGGISLSNIFMQVI
ncbi:MAG: small multi-drug export protein [Methanomethylovorans sp.]|uniref:COG2426 family protein n=1 Tax=Methanomethylovorans sp. TaxID=2758717 RepID=UPI000A3E46BD